MNNFEEAIKLDEEYDRNQDFEEAKEINTVYNDLMDKVPESLLKNKDISLEASFIEDEEDAHMGLNILINKVLVGGFDSNVVFHNGEQGTCVYQDTFFCKYADYGMNLEKANKIPCFYQNKACKDIVDFLSNYDAGL